MPWTPPLPLRISKDTASERKIKSSAGKNPDRERVPALRSAGLSAAFDPFPLGRRIIGQVDRLHFNDRFARRNIRFRFLFGGWAGRGREQRWNRPTNRRSISLTPKTASSKRKMIPMMTIGRANTKSSPSTSIPRGQVEQNFHHIHMETPSRFCRSAS
ncbi:MAG: hypothetical protein L6W00_28460 [Lentisphaeria bacterium]|nr:MAG: hypothetical protein L6W00_28460 [Lentisphaeria bacterium]